MSAEDDFDPFAGIDDVPGYDRLKAREELLESAKRGYVPLRKSFVQRPDASRGLDGRVSARASILADLVSQRKERPLDLLLLIHAYQPILSGTPLPLATWANVLGTTTTGVSRAAEALRDMNLLERHGSVRRPEFVLKREDGSGHDWGKPGIKAEEGKGYFALPHAYWTHGHADALRLPGKAMLLIMLKETQDPKTPAFSMAVERAKDFYGISERTAERGYRALDDRGLLHIKVQKVPDARHPAGRREKYWRALKEPFDPVARRRLQAAAAKASRPPQADGAATETPQAPLPGGSNE